MTLIGTFWTFSSRLVAVMMISVWSGTWPSCATCTCLGGDVTSVALVPGAGDCPVVCGCASCAQAGETNAVEARNPSVSARSVRSVIANAPIRLCRHSDRGLDQSQQQ